MKCQRSDCDRFADFAIKLWIQTLGLNLIVRLCSEHSSVLRNTPVGAPLSAHLRDVTKQLKTTQTVKANEYL